MAVCPIHHRRERHGQAQVPDGAAQAHQGTDKSTQRANAELLHLYGDASAVQAGV